MTDERPWVKLYRHESPRFRCLSFGARALSTVLITLADDEGRIWVADKGSLASEVCRLGRAMRDETRLIKADVKELLGFGFMTWDPETRVCQLADLRPFSDVEPREEEKRRRARERSRVNRIEILDRDKWVCSYCACALDAEIARVDHIIPISKGGTSDPDNLAAACFACNASKGAKLLSEWRPVQ